MKATFIIAITIFLLAGHVLSAQYLQGTVRDAGTGIPLSGANIVSPSGTGTVTGNKGEFIMSIPEEKAVLSISYIGYSPLQTDTIFINNDTLHKTFYLHVISASLDEVVISAGKFEQRLEEITVSLDILKPALLQDKNQVQLQNVLQQVPGVNVTDGQANIRGGSGWSYGTGTRVQTLVDGIPLISGDAAQAQWSLVPVYSLEKVEILKGASSVLYGSAALNGVINIITHSLPRNQELNVNLYSGFYDSPERKSLKWWNRTRTNSGLNFDLQQPVSANSGLLLSGGVINDEGFRYLEEDKSGKLFGKFFWIPEEIKSVELSLASHVFYSNGGNALIWENDSMAYIPLDSGITKTSGWDFYIDPHITYITGKFKHTVQGRYLRLNNDAQTNKTNYSNSSDQYFGQYYLQYFYSTKLALTMGFSTSYTTSRSVVFVGKHTSANNAVFLQSDYKPLDWLNLNIGMRYEDFYLDDRYYSKPVFRGGLNARIVKGTNFRFSYGEAFRFPAISEAYTATSLGSIMVYPNPDLRPETGYSAEVGLRQMFYISQLKGYVDVAAFQMRYHDMIEYTFGGWGEPVLPTFGLGFKSVNVGETVIAGAEISTALEGKLSHKTTYRVLVGYTYVIPQVVNPQRPFARDNIGRELTYLLSSSDPSNDILKYRYQHLFKLDVQIESGRWHGGFSLRYNDFMQNIDQSFNDFITGVKGYRKENQHGDFIVDLRAGYDISKHFSLDIIVNNLLNREVLIRPGLMGPPRFYSLRINYQL